MTLSTKGVLRNFTAADMKAATGGGGGTTATATATVTPDPNVVAPAPPASEPVLSEQAELVLPDDVAPAPAPSKRPSKSAPAKDN